MNSDRLKLIWKNGVPLNEAFAKYSDKNSIRFIDHAKALYVDPNRDEVENIKLLGRSFGALANSFIDIASFPAKEREWVISALCQKQLMAIGYKTGPDASIVISSVPEPFLNLEYINWKSSEISGLKVEFIDVRICIYKKYNFAKDGSKPIGRPTKKEAVWQIINSIELSQLQLKCGANKTAIANEIHKFGLLEYPDQFSDKSPSSQTIIRHYNSYLEHNSDN